MLCFAAFITVGIKLRRVHDAFFIKDEFKLILLTIVVFGIPSVALASTESTKTWGGIVGLGCIICTAIWSFTIPVIKSYRVDTYSSHSSSSSETTKEETELEQAEGSDTQQDDRESTFTRYPKIYSLVKSPIADKYVRQFILHYQDLISTDLLNLRSQALEFRSLPPEMRAGKGYLLFLKFVSRNAYRYIACIRNEQREIVEKKLNAAMEENSQAVIGEDLFDEILDTIEMELIEKLYKPFIKSEFFVKYREAMVLNENLA